MVIAEISADNETWNPFFSIYRFGVAVVAAAIAANHHQSCLVFFNFIVIKWWRFFLHMVLCVFMFTLCILHEIENVVAHFVCLQFSSITQSTANFAYFHHKNMPEKKHTSTIHMHTHKKSSNIKHTHTIQKWSLFDYKCS